MRLQPLPPSPTLDTSHLQQPSGNHTAVDLGNGNDRVKVAEADGQFIAFVKVRQVEHLHH